MFPSTEDPYISNTFSKMATPKRSLVPLFLLFSFSALLLFSLHNFSSSSSSHYSSPTTFTSLQTSNPNPLYTNFTLTIKVLTFDRLSSLSRCLKSLANAYYDNDKVNLHIFIDHFKISENISIDLDRKLNESRKILDFVDGFSWKFGDKLVHYRTGNVGLQAQWLESWWPTSDNEFAFVVEDDLEVSPLYYRFIRGLIVNYYYNASNFSPWIYGASLQRPRFVPGKHGNKMKLNSGTHLFLYQLVGTWGQLLFPRPWKEFRMWYDNHKAKGMKPFLEGMVTTGWYKRMGERIWTPWFIKFIHARGYFNIYTNFLRERALSVSHRDAGVNYGKTAGPDSYLLDENSLDFNLLKMQPLISLKWYNFCFSEVLPDRIVRSFDELRPVLQSVHKLETVILVSLYRASEIVTRNLLCQFERLNVQNYIILGPTSNLLLDLARRGHPVIDVNQFFDSIRTHKSTRFQESNVERIKEILVKAYVIKKSLEDGYNTWVLDSNMLPVSSDSFLDSFDPTYDFYIGKTFEYVFIRSSVSARKVWVDDFIDRVSVMNVDSLRLKDSVSTYGRHFAYAVENLLEQKGTKFKRVDEMSLNINAIDVNRTSLSNGKKICFWSLVMDLILLQKRLEELGIWVIDHDSSCSAVICHPSLH